MDTSSISVAIAGFSLGIAALSLFRMYKKDTQETTKGQTQDLTRIETKVDYVGSDVKEMRDDIKAQGVLQSQMSERLTRVEESTKSAHHRIDALENKGE